MPGVRTGIAAAGTGELIPIVHGGTQAAAEMAPGLVDRHPPIIRVVWPRMTGKRKSEPLILGGESRVRGVLFQGTHGGVYPGEGACEGTLICGRWVVEAPADAGRRDAARAEHAGPPLGPAEEDPGRDGSRDAEPADAPEVLTEQDDGEEGRNKRKGQGRTYPPSAFSRASRRFTDTHTADEGMLPGDARSV